MKYRRPRQQLPRIADKHAVEQLIKHARQPYKAILAVLYETGLRRSEVLSLRYGDVEEWEYGF